VDTAAEEASTSEPVAPVIGGLGAFGGRRQLARARKGGLPLFNKPLDKSDDSDSDNEVCAKPCLLACITALFFASRVSWTWSHVLPSAGVLVCAVCTCQKVSLFAPLQAEKRRRARARQTTGDGLLSVLPEPQRVLQPREEPPLDDEQPIAAANGAAAVAPAPEIVSAEAYRVHDDVATAAMPASSGPTPTPACAAVHWRLFTDTNSVAL
jgi:hypothetical protein